MKTKTLLSLALGLSFATAYAQEQVLNSEPIDVDGYLHEKNVTDGELEQIRSEIRKQKNETQLNKDKSKGYKELSKTTEKLSETTEEYLDEKKSAQKDIAEYNKKIKCLMEENPSKDCAKYVRNRREEPEVEAAPEVKQEVAVSQAAPAAVSVVEAPVTDPDAPFETMKLIPYAGSTQYNGEVEQLEAQISAGLRLESNITSRFSMGIGANFAQFKTDDYGGDVFNSNNYNWYNQYSNFYGAREIQFRTMGIDLYGKFFITKGERFRPYVGAALGFNRSNMKYTNNETQDVSGYTFGNEEYTTSYATGTLMAGSEIMITRGFGLNIEAAMGTGLGNSLTSQSAKNATNSPDQRRLRQLGEEIINSNQLSIFAGAVVLF